jgi:MraZ protein
MEFNGEHECKLDAKGRVLLPFRLKNKLPDDNQELILARGLDPCLALFTRSAWKEVSERLARMDAYEPEDRRVHRSVYAGSLDVELDGQGRILIPKLMQQWASLAGDILAVGNRNCIEFWNLALYQQYVYGNAADLSAAAQRQSAKNPPGVNFHIHKN